MRFLPNVTQCCPIWGEKQAARSMEHGTRAATCPSNKFINKGPNQAALLTTMCNRGHLIKACLHLHLHLSLHKQQYIVLAILECICSGEL